MNDTAAHFGYAEVANRIGHWPVDSGTLERLKELPEILDAKKKTRIIFDYDPSFPKGAIAGVRGLTLFVWAIPREQRCFREIIRPVPIDMNSSHALTDAAIPNRHISEVVQLFQQCLPFVNRQAADIEKILFDSFSPLSRINTTTQRGEGQQDQRGSDRHGIFG